MYTSNGSLIGNRVNVHYNVGACHSGVPLYMQVVMLSFDEVVVFIL